MIFTVHHTCGKEGGISSVLKEFPFLSKYDPKNGRNPFLGQGYYFWEYNLEYAKVWGRNHYNNRFYVCESDININHELDGFYLDIAGNRKHLVGFVELLLEFNLIHEEGTKGIDLCWIINYLRTECPVEAFPYEVIRAVDYKNQDLAGIKIEFNNKQNSDNTKNSYTILNPRIIISFRNKEHIEHLKEPFITFET